MSFHLVCMKVPELAYLEITKLSKFTKLVNLSLQIVTNRI